MGRGDRGTPPKGRQAMSEMGRQASLRSPSKKMIKNKKQAIILLGPPGSGKGTQANLLAEKLGFVHLDSGDIIREHFKKFPDDPEVKKAKRLYNQGELIPPSTITKWIKEKIKGNIISSGSPRTLYEAKKLKEFFKKNNYELKIFNIAISPQETMKRNTLRGRDIIDTPKKIKERLEVYEKRTKPVLDFFSSQVIQINGEQTIEKVHQDIINAGGWSDIDQDNESSCQSCPARCPYRRT